MHVHLGFAIGVTQGEGRLGLYEFNQDFERYMAVPAKFFAEQKIEGPFAVTLALQSLNETEPLKVFFPRTASVRTLRPRLLDTVDDPELLADFVRRVKQATVWDRVFRKDWNVEESEADRLPGSNELACFFARRTKGVLR